MASSNSLLAYSHANESTGIVMRSKNQTSTYLSCIENSGQLLAVTGKRVAIASTNFITFGYINDAAGFTFVEEAPNLVLQGAPIIALAAGDSAIASVLVTSWEGEPVSAVYVTYIPSFQKNTVVCPNVECAYLPLPEHASASISMGSNFLVFSIDKSVLYSYVNASSPYASSYALDCTICDGDLQYGTSVALSLDDTWLAVTGTNNVYLFQLQAQNAAYSFYQKLPQFIQCGMYVQLDEDS